MKKTILFVLCFLPSLFFGVDRHIASRFEQIMNKSVGIISTFPEEIRERRSGGLQQKIEISDDGILTLSFSFPCSPLPEEGRKAKIETAKSRKKFDLGKLGVKSTQRYEINRHLNTLAFYDHGVAWMVAFRNNADLDLAAKLLLQLIASVKRKETKQIAPSKLAEEMGFRYVVFAPRASTLDDELRLLRTGEQSSSLVCWLTKNEPYMTKELLTESYNALPLFFYDLSILDQSPFYTVSSPGMAFFSQCDLGGEYRQSAFSDDEEGLKRFFHESWYSGIRFETMPSFKSPAAIFSSVSEKKMRQKAKSRGIDGEAAITQEMPAYDDPEIPRGSTSTWLAGINDNSDDIFRYLFWNNGITRQPLSKTLYREFPELSTLLKTKSRYRKELSLEDTLLLRMRAYYALAGGLSLFSKRVLAVACFSNELGAPFGSDEELYFNTSPLALAVAEKLGLQENEKKAVELLIHDQPIVGSKQKEKNSLSLFVQEAKQASELKIPMGEWISLKMSFALILSKQFRSVPSNISSQMKEMQDLALKYKILLPFGMPLGLSLFNGPLPARSVFSTYIWEVRDPKHRDGLVLKRRRDKFEAMMIEKPKSPWKGRFFDWLEKEGEKDKLVPQIYLKTDAERSQYLAIFEKGLLLFPSSSPTQEEEFLFVVDTWGRIYLSPKKTAEPGFSFSSFFSGEPVASAGKMTVQGGHIIGLETYSSHYPSGPKEMRIMLEALQKAGVPLQTVHVTIDSETSGQKKEWTSGQEFLQEMN